MPQKWPGVNPTQPLDPDRFLGSSVEQLERMTDLLLNYDWYLGRRRSVREEMNSP